MQNIVGEHPALVARHTRRGSRRNLRRRSSKFGLTLPRRSSRRRPESRPRREASVVDAAPTIENPGCYREHPELLDHADQETRSPRRRRHFLSNQRSVRWHDHHEIQCASLGRRSFCQPGIHKRNGSFFLRARLKCSRRQP